MSQREPINLPEINKNLGKHLSNMRPLPRCKTRSGNGYKIVRGKVRRFQKV